MESFRSRIRPLYSVGLSEEIPPIFEKATEIRTCSVALRAHGIPTIPLTCHWLHDQLHWSNRSTPAAGPLTVWRKSFSSLHINTFWIEYFSVVKVHTFIRLLSSWEFLNNYLTWYNINNIKLYNYKCRKRNVPDRFAFIYELSID